MLLLIAVVSTTLIATVSAEEGSENVVFAEERKVEFSKSTQTITIIFGIVFFTS